MNLNLTKPWGLFLLLILIPFLSWAQTLRYSGKIYSTVDQTTIPGVAVQIKGTSRGTLTSADGSYEITAKSGETLVISGIGIMVKEVVLGSQKDLSIYVAANNRLLNEVVVTALGIKKESKRIGYSLQEVKGSELLKAREPNPINGLAGKVAGLNVGITQELLSPPTVLLRGNVVTLYVVDGIPINSDTFNISPDDIETYTVLKGPAASALYGSQGFNGAILITTKRGKKSDRGFDIQVNSSFQINKGFTAIPKVQNEYGGGDYDQYAFGDGSGGGVNDGDYDVWGPRLDGRLLPQYDGKVDLTQTYVTTFKDGSGNTLLSKGVPVTFSGHISPTPWVARGVNNLQGYLQTGLLSTNNINFSTGSEHSNLRISASNQSQRGILPNTGVNTVNFNVIGGFDINNRLKVEGSINFNHQFTPNVPDVLYGPNSTIYNVDIWTGADWNIDQVRNYWQPGKVGTQSLFVEYKRYHNPWFVSYEWQRGHYKSDIEAQGSINYKIIKNVEATIRSNISTYDLLRNEKEPFSAHPYGDEHNHGNYREDHRELFQNSTDAILSFNGNLGKSGINLSLLTGGNLLNFHYNSLYTSTDQLIVPNVYNFQNSLKPTKSYSYLANMLVLSGYYSADITFKKLFTVSTTGRVEKSSALFNQTYFYPSAGIATVLSDYIALPSPISFFKLRGSYANVKEGNRPSTIGSTPTGSDPFGYGLDYQSNYNGPNYTNGSQLPQANYASEKVYNNQTGAEAVQTTIIPGIKPQNRSNTEFGLDIRFLQNRLGFSGTYFNYVNGPQIAQTSISSSSGQSFLTQNAVKTRRNGYEFSLTGSPVTNKKGLSWDISANLGTYKEVYITAPASGNTFQFKQGDRTDKLFGYVTIKSPDGQVVHDSKSGLPLYLPVQQYIGNADPDFSWGINNKFSYKSFTLSFQFDGMVGGKIQDRVKRKLYEGGRGIETATGTIGKARRYESDNFAASGYAGAVDGSGNPILSVGSTVTNGVPINFDPITGAVTNSVQNNNALVFGQNKTATQYVQDYVSSFYNNVEHTVVSKTFAKLREVVIGYSLPSEMFSGKSVIRRVDISIVGRNLLYFFNKNFKDIDVDQYPGRDANNNANREYNLQTPTTRSYGVNVNISF